MPEFRISVEAENDIDQIVAYTVTTWSWRQADLYLAKLEDGFQLLASHSSIGGACEVLQAGLRKFEIGSHVVFYLPEPDGVLIVRVLHQRMLPTNFFSFGAWKYHRK